MGLDNPDALYFHSYLRDDAEYVVTGRRGSTTDLSFQVLNGDYSPVEVPDSLTAFDDREIEVAGDGTFELRFGPGGPQAELLHARPGIGHARWSARCTATGTPSGAAPSASTAPTAPGGRRGVPDTAAMAKRYRVAGKILLSRLRTFLAFPEWFYLKLPVNTMTEPRPHPRRPRLPVLLGRPLSSSATTRR